MASLYEINNAIALYEMEFDPDTGEWINEKELDALQMDRAEKIESLLLWAKNLNAEGMAIKAEADVLKDRYKRIENKIRRIEDYVAGSLAGEKFSTPRVEVTWRKSEKVIIPDEFKVPDKFVNLSVERKPVKSEIKKYLKSIEGTDEKCEWASLEVKNNMSVK